jgi:hypothetical protein
MKKLRAAGLRVFLICSLLLMHTAVPRIAAGQGSSMSEYELKASILVNLARFVEWPTSSYNNSKAPIVLCVLGRDPFGNLLRSAVLNKTVDGRLMLVRYPQNGTDIGGCHLLFISSSERKAAAEIFSILQGASVLTVGEMTQFAAQGGMVQLSLEHQQVHFDINMNVASGAGLKISAKLLVIARIVTSQLMRADTGN